MRLGAMITSPRQRFRRFVEFLALPGARKVAVARQTWPIHVVATLWEADSGPDLIPCMAVTALRWQLKPMARRTTTHPVA